MAYIKNYFKLFASCIPVKGYESSLIYDIDRHEMITIDNLVFDVLKNNEDKKIDDLKKFYNHEYDKGIDAYLSKFIELEYGFFTNSPESFPHINLEWHSPLFIQNAILEVTGLNNYSMKQTINQLNDLGCQGIQIRFFNEFDLNQLDEILSCFSESRIKGFELFVKYDETDDVFFRTIIEILWRK